jgi:hypothetical protein
VLIASLMLERATNGARVGRMLSRARRRYLPPETPGGKLITLLLRFLGSLYRRGIRQTLWLSAQRLLSHRDEDLVSNAGEPSLRQAAPPEYARWISFHEPTLEQLDEQRRNAGKLQERPLFSVILPIYEVPAAVLEATLISLQKQTYPLWEACIAYADSHNEGNWCLLQAAASMDDRIRLRRLSVNEGISGNSNAALALARGDFVALLDHDDELAPWALHDMAARIAGEPDIDFLYSDKDWINETGTLRSNALFKPAWSPEMLYSANYLTHLCVMRRSIVEAVGGWREVTDGAQDWDIFYRVTEQSRKIARVSGVHYHWRTLSTSVATGLAAKPYAALAQLRTQQDRVRRLGLRATVVPHHESGFRLLWQLEAKPLVDLIVGGTTCNDQLMRFMSELRRDTGGLLASVAIVRRGKARGGPVSGDGVGRAPIRHFYFGAASGESAAMLQAASAGTAPVVAFIDASLRSASGDWLRELAGWVGLHPEIAFAGATILTGNDTIVEGGRIVGDDGRSLPLFRGTPLRHGGWFGHPLWFRNVSAVSPLAAAFKRADWESPGSPDLGRPWPEIFISRCLAVRGSGRRGMITPHARLYMDALPDEALATWDESFTADPYFHPAFRSVTPLMLKRP